MKKTSIKATTGKKGQPDYKEFSSEVSQADNWQEAIKIAGGEDKALALFNRQVKTDALNALRAPSVDPWEKLLKTLPESARAEVEKIKSKYQK